MQPEVDQEAVTVHVQLLNRHQLSKLSTGPEVIMNPRRLAAGGLSSRFPLTT